MITIPPTRCDRAMWSAIAAPPIASPTSTATTDGPGPSPSTTRAGPSPWPQPRRRRPSGLSRHRLPDGLRTPPGPPPQAGGEQREDDGDPEACQHDRARASRSGSRNGYGYQSAIGPRIIVYGSQTSGKINHVAGDRPRAAGRRVDEPVDQREGPGRWCGRRDRPSARLTRRRRGRGEQHGVHDPGDDLRQRGRARSTRNRDEASSAGRAASATNVTTSSRLLSTVK